MSKHISENYLCMIMPAKNVEKFVYEAVISYISHEREDILLIIIDDHSTDNTYKICENLQKKHPDKILLKKNILYGKVNAINYGFSLAKASYYKFVDADDILKDEFWSMLHSNVRKRKSFVHPFETVDENLKKISILPMPHQLVSNNKKYIRNLILLPKVAWTFKDVDIKEMFPIPDGMPFEDIWFSLYVYASNIEVINEKTPAYLYRQHGNQTFGNIRNINEERIIFRFKRIYLALKIIEKNIIFKGFKTELVSSKVVSLYMLRKISLKMLLYKSGFLTAFKYFILRDFKNMYNLLRGFVWSIRRINFFKK